MTVTRKPGSRENAQLLVRQRHLLDSNDKCCGSHAFFRHPRMMHLTDGAVCRDHRLFQPRVNEIDFFGSSHKEFLIFFGNRFADHFLDRADELLVFDFFQMLLKPAKSHMRQVLSPFEI